MSQVIFWPQGRLRQENYEFKPNLGYKVSYWPTNKQCPPFCVCYDLWSISIIYSTGSLYCVWHGIRTQFFKKAYVSSIFLSIFLQCSLNCHLNSDIQLLLYYIIITWGLWSVWTASVLYRWSLCIIAWVQIIWKLLAERIWDLTRSSKDFWFFIHPSSPEVRSCTVAHLPKSECPWAQLWLTHRSKSLHAGWFTHL